METDSQDTLKPPPVKHMRELILKDSDRSETVVGKFGDEDLSFHFHLSHRTAEEGGHIVEVTTTPAEPWLLFGCGIVRAAEDGRKNERFSRAWEVSRPDRG